MGSTTCPHYARDSKIDSDFESCHISVKVLDQGTCHALLCVHFHVTELSCKCHSALFSQFPISNVNTIGLRVPVETLYLSSGTFNYSLDIGNYLCVLELIQLSVKAELLKSCGCIPLTIEGLSSYLTKWRIYKAPL